MLFDDILFMFLASGVILSKGSSLRFAVTINQPNRQDKRLHCTFPETRDMLKRLCLNPNQVFLVSVSLHILCQIMVCLQLPGFVTTNAT